MRTLALVAGAAVLATLAVACGAGPEEDATVATPTVNETAPTEPDREQAPAIEGVSLDGASISLADFRGRPVLINAWSSW